MYLGKSTSQPMSPQNILSGMERAINGKDKLFAISTLMAWSYAQVELCNRIHPLTEPSIAARNANWLNGPPWPTRRKGPNQHHKGTDECRTQ